MVTLRNPAGGEPYGFIPEAGHSGPAEAVLRYSCFSPIVASSSCRILKLPSIDYFDDFGSVSQLGMDSEAPQASSRARRQSAGLQPG